jgi:hypothetical protein
MGILSINLRGAMVAQRILMKSHHLTQDLVT